MNATAALLSPLFLDFVHEIVTQILMIVHILLCADLLDLLLLFELRPLRPIHGLATVLESYVLFGLCSSLIHEFLTLVKSLFACFVFHPSLRLLDRDDRTLIFFLDAIFGELAYLIIKLCITANLGFDHVQLV